MDSGKKLFLSSKIGFLTRIYDNIISSSKISSTEFFIHIKTILPNLNFYNLHTFT